MDKKIEQFISKESVIKADSKPVILNLRNDSDKMTLSRLITDGKIHHVVDDYNEQLKEYFQVTNPTLVYAPHFGEEFSKYCKDLEKEMPFWQQGMWVYFPWISTLSHILEEEAFYLVRTARNRNLINKEEQDKFYNSVVGIAGLSVGNSIALTIVLQGGAKHIRLADFDRLSLSNTNRVRAGVDSLGLPKVEMTARQIYVLNPYATIELFPEGLTKESVVRFFEGLPKLDIVIDELDNLAIKYLIREYAKKNRLAVIMGADNGDNAVIDIERYDENPDTKFFHGRMGEVSYDELSKLDKLGIGKTITKHIGPENVTERMQESLLEMGKTIVSWPQLGGAALVNGSAAAYCARKILNKEPLEGNRAIISLDEKLVPNYNSPEEIAKREKVSEGFKKIFGL